MATEGPKQTSPRRNDWMTGWTPSLDSSFQRSSHPLSGWPFPREGTLLDHSPSYPNGQRSSLGLQKGGTSLVQSFCGFNWSRSCLRPLTRCIRLDGPPAGGPLPPFLLLFAQSVAISVAVCTFISLLTIINAVNLISVVCRKACSVMHLQSKREIAPRKFKLDCWVLSITPGDAKLWTALWSS